MEIISSSDIGLVISKLKQNLFLVNKDKLVKRNSFTQAS